MKWAFHGLRNRALQILTRTVKPSLPLGAYLVPSLAFETPGDAARFIHDCGGAMEEVAAPSGEGIATGGAAEGGEGAAAAPPPEFRLFLDGAKSHIELVREVTEEEISVKGAALTDYLKMAVAQQAPPQL